MNITIDLVPPFIVLMYLEGMAYTKVITPYGHAIRPKSSRSFSRNSEFQVMFGPPNLLDINPIEHFAVQPEISG